MRRLLLVAVLPFAACGADAGSATFEASLRIRLDPDGDGPRAVRTAALRCPSERLARQCRYLRELRVSVFEPVPPDVACTQVYGGPQRARIRGTIRGRAVDGRFSRVDGCEIARYERVRPLLRLAR